MNSLDHRSGRRATTWSVLAALSLLVLSGCASGPGAHPDHVVESPVAAVQRPHADVEGAPATYLTATPAPNETEIQAPAADVVAEAVTQGDLWDRMRAGFGMPDLEGDLVQGREQYYASRADAVRRMTERGGRYLFHILDEVERRRMPTELALLPFVESAFNPQALSVARAAGMWQFIPSTGKDYDLKQNVFRDDRRDVLASTRAALDYLSRLHQMFGDWHLALAAYNWGEGNVKKAIARNEKASLPIDYASLRMPAETRLYVPKLQAIKNIVTDPDRFGVTLAPLRNHPYFISVSLERDLDVALAARLAGIPVEEFKHLNPQMNKPVILAAGTEQLLLPYDNAVEFTRNLAAHTGPLASWTAWVAPRNLAPAEAARLLGMSESALREVNHIPSGMLIRAGSTLLVPRTPQRQDDVSEHLADNATVAFVAAAPVLRKLTLRTGRKVESVATVAARHRVSPAQFAQWNRTAVGASLRPGTQYVVHVPAATTRVAVAGHGPARASKTSPARAPARTQKSVRVAMR